MIMVMPGADEVLVLRRLGVNHSTTQDRVMYTKLGCLR